VTLSLKFSGQTGDDAMPVIGRASRIAVSKITGIFIVQGFRYDLQHMKKLQSNVREKEKEYDC